MAYTTIKKPSDYFNTKLYTGTGSSNALTGVGFQPDWVWFKSRNQAYNHYLFDVVRGVNKPIHSSLTNAESTQTDTLMSFDSDGFTLGSDTNNGEINSSGNTFASWNWKANGAGSANTDGSISSTVSANTTSGFSIVSYTGTGSAGTLGHGLGSTPKMIIVKCRSDADTWAVYHENVGATKYMELDTTAGEQVSTQPWNDTAPASSVFTVGNWSATNGSGRTYIAYCFSEVKGFSKFGSYTGNGNADGTFVYTGFKPAMVIIKRTNTAANWVIFDNKRGAYNSNSPELQPNTNAAEAAVTDRFDFVSNGIKFRSSSYPNGSGNSFIYMAFAEEPLVGDNPATAR